MDWISTTWPDVGRALLSIAVVYSAIVLYTRVMGLRSFSKMSAPDFAMTLAIGSLFAGAISSNSPPLLLTLVIYAGLFLGQWLVARLRVQTRTAESIIDNPPVLLMRGPTILRDNLRRTNVTMSDLMGKLREANAYRFEQVHAVVFETTGEISVLHGDPSDGPMDFGVMTGVSGWSLDPDRQTTSDSHSSERTLRPPSAD